MKSKLPGMICKALHDLGIVFIPECVLYHSSLRSFYLSHTGLLATLWTHGSDLASNAALDVSCTCKAPSHINSHGSLPFSFRPEILTLREVLAAKPISEITDELCWGEAVDLMNSHPMEGWIALHIKLKLCIQKSLVQPLAQPFNSKMTVGSVSSSVSRE